MLTLPHSALQAVAQFAPPKNSKNPNADTLRAVFIRRLDGAVELTATDGHVAARASFPHLEAHNLPDDGTVVCLPIGAYAGKAKPGAIVTITPTESGYVVRTIAPNGAATEELLSAKIPAPTWLDAPNIIPTDLGSLRSTYCRWTFDPALMARICKAAGANRIQTLSTHRRQACVFAWQLSSDGPTLPDGANLTAVLMPIVSRSEPTDDPHNLYAVSLKPEA